MIGLHERCFRLVCNDKQSRFEELLAKDGFVSIHHRNIKSLAVEMYKVRNESSPEVMNEIFQLREDKLYNLCQAFQFIAHVNIACNETNVFLF